MLVAKKVRAGAMKGDRRSIKRGTSVEFADYRNYVPGDDLRQLDWNIYARLERPYIKLLEDEEDLAVHIILDASAQNVAADGIADLNIMLKDYALRASRPGLTVVVSDMFSPSGYIEGLNALLSRGHEVALVHILSPQEVTPPLAGDLRLIDVETGQAQEVTVDAAMREFYHQRLTAWRDEIRDECHRRGVHYFALQTDEPWERLILSDMRRVGLVK